MAQLKSVGVAMVTSKPQDFHLQSSIYVIIPKTQHKAAQEGEINFKIPP